MFASIFGEILFRVFEVRVKEELLQQLAVVEGLDGVECVDGMNLQIYKYRIIRGIVYKCIHVEQTIKYIYIRYNSNQIHTYHR